MGFFDEKKYRNYFPGIWSSIDGIVHRSQTNSLKNDIIKYLEGTPGRELTVSGSEINEIVGFLNKNDLTVFPYEYTKKYKMENIACYTDKASRLPYVVWEDKKLFFKEGTNTLKMKKLVIALQMEQDEQSPHRYTVNGFDVEKGDVLLDVGAAEGNFSLSNIDKVSRAVVLEADESWMKPLEMTFRPWSEKVEIIAKYVSDKDSEKEITIDSIRRKSGKVDFVKIDVEGAEEQVLNGAAMTIKEEPALKLALCTYHKQGDAQKFGSLLTQKGFDISFSDGHMIFFYDKNISAPYLRKGLIRAIRKNGK